MLSFHTVISEMLVVFMRSGFRAERIGSVDNGRDEALFVWRGRPELSRIANTLTGIGCPR
jgi:hypothetical protein